MASNCKSCDDLRQNAPNVLANGVDDTACTSLKNDTGFNPASSTNSCDDLEDANDCLIGSLEDEIEAYDVCDWKEFMKKLIPNLYIVLKGIICTICGLWAYAHHLCSIIKRATFVGIMTLYTTQSDNESTGNGDGVKTVVLPFEKNKVVGNAPDGVFTADSNNKGITVNNTTDVPLLVDVTYNCSIRTNQYIASCYLVVQRDGRAIGQTPFITPSTYDQQAVAESFILEPGETAKLTYYFGVGQANATYREKFGLHSGETTPYVHAMHEREVASNPENQRSYFSVKVTSILPEASC